MTIIMTTMKNVDVMITSIITMTMMGSVEIMTIIMTTMKNVDVMITSIIMIMMRIVAVTTITTTMPTKCSPAGAERR